MRRVVGFHDTWTGSLMAGSDLTDRTRTGPYLGSHLSDTVNFEFSLHPEVRKQMTFIQREGAVIKGANDLFIA
jgi:hypothetical protein